MKGNRMNVRAGGAGAGSVEYGRTSCANPGSGFNAGRLLGRTGATGLAVVTSCGTKTCATAA
jgi:hypothetical protein